MPRFELEQDRSGWEEPDDGHNTLRTRWFIRETTTEMNFVELVPGHFTEADALRIVELLNEHPDDFTASPPPPTP